MENLEFTRTIKLPKNRITLTTYDKDGNITKERNVANTWTWRRYGLLWVGTTSPGSSRLLVKISNGTGNITPATGNISGTIIYSNEGYANSLTEEEVNGKFYYVLTHNRTYGHGSINMGITQIGLGEGGGSVNGNIFCGTRLNDEFGNVEPFNVTNQERLVVVYKLYIPKLLTALLPGGSGKPYDDNDSNSEIYSTTNILINGITPVEVTGRRRLFAKPMPQPVISLDIRLNNGITPGSLFYVNASDGTIYAGAVVTLTHNFTNNFYNYTSTASIVLEPINLGAITIKGFIIPAADPSASFLVEFDPPLVKGANDRLAFSFTYTVNLEEEDF